MASGIRRTPKKRTPALAGLDFDAPAKDSKSPVRAFSPTTESQARTIALAIKHGLSDNVLADLILEGRTPESPQAKQAVIDVYRDRGMNAPWPSLGEQLVAIERHYTGGGTDPRLFSAASGGNASVGGDGGFAIQTDFALDLVTGAIEGSVLAGRCSEYPIEGAYDSLEVAFFEEQSRATGSRFGGVQVYRVAEAEIVEAAGKPQLGRWKATLEDLNGLAYVTERVAQDATDALGRVFEEAFREESSWIIDDEVFQGNGAGRCLGVLQSGATVQVPKETGQPAGTIVAENIGNIWKRVPGGSKRRGIWVFAPEAEDQIASAMTGIGAATTIQYARPGATDLDHYLTIHGRPAYPLEQAPGVGEVGDIAFLDLSRYGLIRKGVGERIESLHVRYLHQERVWKWTVRINGAPKLSAPLTPARGDPELTLSPFVTLAARH